MANLRCFFKMTKGALKLLKTLTFLFLRSPKPSFFYSSGYTLFQDPSQNPQSLILSVLLSFSQCKKLVYKIKVYIIVASNVFLPLQNCLAL